MGFEQIDLEKKSTPTVCDGECGICDKYCLNPYRDEMKSRKIIVIMASLLIFAIAGWLYLK